MTGSCNFQVKKLGNWTQATEHSFQSYLMCTHDMPGLCEPGAGVNYEQGRQGLVLWNYEDKSL